MISLFTLPAVLFTTSANIESYVIDKIETQTRFAGSLGNLVEEKLTARNGSQEILITVEPFHSRCVSKSKMLKVGDRISVSKVAVNGTISVRLDEILAQR